VPADRGACARGDSGQRVAQHRLRRPGGAGGARARPSGVSRTATRNPKAAVGSWRSCPARARSSRSQPRTVPAGTPSCAPTRTGPAPCSTDSAAARATTPWHRRRAGAPPTTAAAGASPGTSGTGRGGHAASPPPAAQPDLPPGPCPHGAQPPGPARRAGRRAGHQGRLRGLRIRAQQHLPGPFRHGPGARPGRFVLHPVRPAAGPQPG
jgi:hypothetical protein